MTLEPLPQARRGNELVKPEQLLYYPRSMPFTMSENLLSVLSDDDDFLRDLGRLILVASRFEKILREYVITYSPEPPAEKDALAPLLKRIRKSMYLAPTLDDHMMSAIRHRNYFVHNLCLKLDGYTSDDFTIMQFKNRLRGLISDIKFFTELLEKDLKEKEPNQ